MRTLIFIIVGLAILGVALALSRPAWRPRVALGFIVLWLAVSAVNLGMGLAAGYPLAEELLVHLFLFGIPALAAAWAWRKFHAGPDT
ncbi:hypothetical protein [Halomonas heilongjiangensis]|uniref:Uncharacterized protein n=1 Tax=Halomonas heilongjiangensis TaxID=1387883 RepID=A0A2N7TLT1_9GAMM|nr:hypothetical protein [Halomonas heilongjiangensis]PMR69153.1 hypothetical protein C1H66_12245 [Halomonas heilongjiangensis]PXX94179.1 hypothetical protein CR158_02395 [Halomonas heilongjiangensis]